MEEGGGWFLRLVPDGSVEDEMNSSRGAESHAATCLGPRKVEETVKVWDM